MYIPSFVVDIQIYPKYHSGHQKSGHELPERLVLSFDIEGVPNLLDLTSIESDQNDVPILVMGDYGVVRHDQKKKEVIFNGVNNYH